RMLAPGLEGRSRPRSWGVFFRRLSFGSALAPTDASGRPGNLSQDDARSSAWLASRAQRRSERQPGGREPEMMQKHDLGGLEGVQPLGDRTLAVGCLVLVDDALADSLVQGAGSGALLDDGLLDVPGFSGQTEPADGGLQRRTNRLVADTGLLVLPVALDLRLDVRHAKTCSS